LLFEHDLEEAQSSLTGGLQVASAPFLSGILAHEILRIKSDPVRLAESFRFLEKASSRRRFQNRDSDNVLATSVNNDPVLAEFAVGSLLRPAEAEIENIRLVVVVDPHLFGWQINEPRHGLQQPSYVLRS
jgi:hypothetical protein